MNEWKMWDIYIFVHQIIFVKESMFLDSLHLFSPKKEDDRTALWVNKNGNEKEKCVIH